jgi:hypothetical protein
MALPPAMPEFAKLGWFFFHIWKAPIERRGPPPAPPARAGGELG